MNVPAEAKLPAPTTTAPTMVPVVITRLDRDGLIDLVTKLWNASENSLASHLQLGVCYELMKRADTDASLTSSLNHAVERVNANNPGIQPLCLRTWRYYARLARCYQAARQQPENEGLIWMLHHTEELVEDLKRAHIETAADLLRPPKQPAPSEPKPVLSPHEQWCADFHALRRRIGRLGTQEFGPIIAQLEVFVGDLHRFNETHESGA